MSPKDILVLGHPYAWIGMGEQMRAGVRALQAVGLEPRVFDVYRHAARDDAAYAGLIGPLETSALDAGLRIFHINGNEIEPVMRHLEAQGFDWAGGHNIVCPAWELPRYPQAWAEQVNRYDGVWAISRSVAGALRAAVAKPVYHVGQSIEQPWPNLLPRRYFNIRESAFVFLTMFDFTSYQSRKNPEGVYEAFRNMRRNAPGKDVQLVIKTRDRRRANAPARSAGPASPAVDRRRRNFIGELASADDPDVLVIDRLLDMRGTASLIAASDCYVSLHRAEGFGRIPAEAMALGKSLVCTAYGGVMDYLDEDNSLLVDFKTRALGADEYPHAESQTWAEPDVDHAARQMLVALRGGERIERMRRRARMDVVARAGNRAVGLRMLDALAAALAPA